MYIKSPEYKKELEIYLSRFSDVFEKLSDSTVLITGAAGLIGNYIVDLLMSKGGIKVVAIDRNEERMTLRFSDYKNNFIPVIGDVNDTAFCEKVFSENKPDYVIHAASNTSPLDYANKPVDTICTNIIATHNLLECVRKYNTKRFMFCSSVEAYGTGSDDVEYFDELYSGYVDCNTVRAGYPSGKRASEAMCNAYMSEYGIDFVNARIGRIYGATVIPEDTKAPTQFIGNAVRNEDIVLKSPGTQVFSFGYVGDCATGMLKMLTHGESGSVYNVADCEGGIMLRDFAAAAASAGGKEVVFDLSTDLAKAGYSKVTRAVLSVKKLESLGWESLYNHIEGTKKTVKYLKELNVL